MQELGIELEQEVRASVFLGVNLEQDLNTEPLEMKQTGVIQLFIKAVCLDYGMSKGKFMILEANPMVKDDNGEPVGGMFRYSSIAGMLIYLSGDTHPDVSLAVGICVRYMFSPKCSYKLTSKIFVGYLKQTKDCGLVLNYNYNVCKVYAYAGVDLSGMFGHEKPKYTAFFNRCTGFIVTFADCPVLWVSKLHTDTALLTTEAEIITMAHCCR